MEHAELPPGVCGAAAWSMAARIAVAAAIPALFTKTAAGPLPDEPPAGHPDDLRRHLLRTRFRHASSRHCEALAAPGRLATAARSRPGSSASCDDRSSCRGRRSQREHDTTGSDHYQARHFWGSHRLVRRFLRGDYVSATRRDPHPQRYQIRIRGRLGETIRSAFPALQARTRGDDTVLTGVFADQAARRRVRRNAPRKFCAKPRSTPSPVCAAAGGIPPALWISTWTGSLREHGRRESAYLSGVAHVRAQELY
jgi:hypothetical protein